MSSLQIRGAFLALSLLCLCQAKGDSIPSQISAGDPLNPGFGVQVSNFGAGNSVYSLFSSGGQQWTNASNFVLPGNLLNLVLSLGGDSSQIALLFQQGAVFGQPAVPIVPATLSSSSSPASGSAALTSSSTVSDVPEPATISLFGESLILFGWYALYHLTRPVSPDENKT